MNKQEILEKFFTLDEQELINRARIKMENSFAVIAKEQWVSKQAITQKYNKIYTHYKTLIDNLKDNDI